MSFGEFYKQIHDDSEQEESEQEIGENENESSTDVHDNNTDVMTRIPEITTEELRTAINKRNPSRRDQSMRRRDERNGETILQRKRNEFTPEAWKKVKIKVRYKKGDVENVGNYRPICSCQRCTNCSRLYCTEVCKHAEDQAGFRSSYQTTDHFATYRMIEQQCREWGIKMRTATIDFTKAFDSTHKSIWNALKSCGIKNDYISLLIKIYKDQKASVQTDERATCSRSRKEPNRVTLCLACFFNTVLQNSLKDDTQRWQKKKGMGIYLSDKDHDCLTNLRFADDVLLFATSKEQLQKMLCDFKKSTEKVGLRIHPEKTKILSNQSKQSSDTKKEMQVDDMKVEILTRGESVRYLGQMITFGLQETTEITNRIRAAWATFHKYRQELTSKNYLLKHRLRLFDVAITPTICYASGTWAPIREHERMMQSTQRKMLRLIIQTKRRYKKIVKQKVKTSEDLD